MSDLQCAATLLLTRPDASRAHDLAATLTGRRIARVYTSSQARAVRTAELVAAALGVDVAVSEGLRAPTEDESEDEIVSRFGEVVEWVADLHRGETVLVVGDGGALSVALPCLVSNLGPGFAPAEGALVEIAADSDDWIRVRGGEF